MSREYRALSIKQPWASLIAHGHKTIETRTYNTNIRGLIVICSSKALALPAMRSIRGQMPDLYEEANTARGLALCTARIVDCHPMTETDTEAAMCEPYDKAHAWVLEDIKRLPKTVPVSGKLGFFKVTL